jgi:hypothetical protein
MTVVVPWDILQVEAMSTFLSGTSAGCVLAGRVRDDQLMRSAKVTLAVRSGPGLTVGCGTRVARSTRITVAAMVISSPGA